MPEGTEGDRNGVAWPQQGRHLSAPFTLDQLLLWNIYPRQNTSNTATTTPDSIFPLSSLPLHDDLQRAPRWPSCCRAAANDDGEWKANELTSNCLKEEFLDLNASLPPHRSAVMCVHVSTIRTDK